MHVSVIGAGAIGGWLTAGCVKAGADVTVLARSATLDALRNDGLWLDDGHSDTRCNVHATDDPKDLCGADILILGLKAHDLPGAAPLIKAALSDHTIVVPAINGLPWWYFESFGGPAKGLRLETVDPGGVLSDVMPTSRVVGSVVYAASYVSAPGRIRLMQATKVWLGDAGSGDHASTVATLLEAGGIPAEASDEIHRHVWTKLWGNSNMNPLSALTRGDLLQMLDDPYVNGLATTMMREMAEIGTLIGLDGFDDIDARLRTTRRLGAFRTSMLQDVEAGRPMEIGPILGSLVELSRHLGHPTPAMDGVYGLTRLLDKNLKT
jgi:2-dehydropantoate 2-reductase